MEKQRARLKEEKSQNVLYWIFGALVRRAHPKICYLSIDQIGWADCKKP